MMNRINTIETVAILCAREAIREWAGAVDMDGDPLLSASAEPQMGDWDALAEVVDYSGDDAVAFVAAYQAELERVLS